DALSTGRRVPSNDPADLAVASMLAHWRDDVRRGPVPELVSVRQAAAALGRAQRPHRSRFVPTVVGAVAAAMLCLGGFGAVLYDSHPGDTLYGLRTFVFGQAPESRNEQVALAAQSQLLQAQQLIQQGQWQQAQDKLAAASTAVQGVPDLERKQELIDQMNQLTVKVAARNPDASLAPGAPPPPPLPGMVVPLPNVVETSAASSPTTSTSSSTSTTTSTTSSTTATTTTTRPSSEQAPPPSSTTTAPTTSTPTTSTPTTTTTTTPPVTLTTTTTVTSVAVANGASSPANTPPVQVPPDGSPTVPTPKAASPTPAGPTVPSSSPPPASAATTPTTTPTTPPVPDAGAPHGNKGH
ncbi:MAG: hypothetical protein JO152_13045, partial [Mycobacteriaceae bacterium]|nr:hypothetical protein [Mycobacteriaceae bacterium]